MGTNCLWSKFVSFYFFDKFHRIMEIMSCNNGDANTIWNWWMFPKEGWIFKLNQYQVCVWFKYNTSVFLIHKTILKSFFAEPVISCDSIMGAIDGPCSGHLSLWQVALMEASAVGQLNSLPSISQTWAPSPGWNLCRTVMWEWCGAEHIAENDHTAWL